MSDLFKRASDMLLPPGPGRDEPGYVRSDPEQLRAVLNVLAEIGVFNPSRSPELQLQRWRMGRR
jgi:hypothetical protein